ncbi:MAG: class I SAM-dependent methyltransferase [Candidatus Peregrinibacteria bacterium]|nr:class I SAM-dependent methyltransferase [Candidatus Peregrinibacteria bacterium]
MREKTAISLLKKVKKDYTEISEEFDKTRKTKWEEFDNFLKYIKDKNIVADVGCGNGRFYEFLKKHKTTKYIGIDNNKKLLEKAKKEKNAKFIKGDLLKIPLKKESVNVVLEIASLHHIPSKKLREKAIKEVNRVLKKNGIFIVSVWNLFQPKYKKYIKKAFLRAILTLGKYDFRDTFIPWAKKAERYYYAFKEKELKRLLETNNFEIIEQGKNNNIVFICKKKK